MKKALYNIDDFSDTLTKFNNKDAEAYGQLYDMLYKELYYYTQSLFKDTEILAEDIIQDVFLEIWENKKLKFTTLRSIRAYIFIVVKNKFLMYCRHRRFVLRESERFMLDNDSFIIQAVEAEVFAIFPQAIGLLPEECAKSIQLLIEGYNIKEIAEKTGKTESAIYKQKDHSIKILKKIMHKGFLFIGFFTR